MKPSFLLFKKKKKKPHTFLLEIIKDLEVITVASRFIKIPLVVIPYIFGF